MGARRQSESKQQLLIKDPRGGGREERLRDCWSGLAPSLQLTVPLSQIYLITQSCWHWRRKVTLTLSPPRPGPSSSRVKVARRRSGGQGEGERGCSGHGAGIRDVGCHRNLWGGVPRRAGGRSSL